MSPGRLPLRDVFLLPLIVVATILVLWGGTEIAARLMFSESGRESCTLKGSAPMRMKPDCVSHRKAAEGPVVEMAYNDCGYRTRESCRPKPAGTLRIALLGASTAQGFKVPYEQSFSARLGKELTQACGRPVDVQNMAVPGYELVDSYMRVDEALAMKPDAVMFLFGPYDVEAISTPERLAARDHPQALRRPKRKPAAKYDHGSSLYKRLVDMTADSRALVMVQHYLYSDRPTYVKLFMMYGDKADYVRAPLSKLWEKRLAIADLLLDGMARKVHAAGIPLIDVLAPTELQVSLLNTPNAPGDAALIDNRLSAIGARHGVITADTLGAFHGLSSPSTVFYSVDGHLNGDGHAILANSVMHRLTAMPAFAGCRANRLAGAMP